MAEPPFRHADVRRLPGCRRRRGHRLHAGLPTGIEELLPHRGAERSRGHLHRRPIGRGRPAARPGTGGRSAGGRGGRRRLSPGAGIFRARPRGTGFECWVRGRPLEIGKAPGASRDSSGRATEVHGQRVRHDHIHAATGSAHGQRLSVGPALNVMPWQEPRTVRFPGARPSRTHAGRNALPRECRVPSAECRHA